MTTKRKKPTLPSQSPAAEPARGARSVLIEGDKHLTPLDLARFNLAQVNVRIALQAVGLRDLEIKNAQLQFDRHVDEFKKSMHQATREREQLVQFGHAEQTAMLELQKEFEVAYDIDFAQPLSYDDKTGRLVALAVPANPVIKE